jgi:hypothetical protein
MRPAGYQLGTGPCDLVRRTDATALLAEKAQRIERLEAAAVSALEVLDHYRYGGSSYRKPALAAIEKLKAALSQPHPHGG